MSDYLKKKQGSETVKLKRIVGLLERHFPPQIAARWDHTGFSFGSDQTRLISGILLCLDLTDEILTFARQRDLNLILTRHPFKFLRDPGKERFFYPYKADLINLIRRTGISVYSLHTNFEVSNATASREIISRLFEGMDREYRLVDLEGLPSAIVVEGCFNLSFLMQLFKDNLGINSFRYLKRSNIYRDINRFILLPGSWSSKDFIAEIADRNIELIITSELRWSDWVNFAESELPDLLEIPHLVETFASGPLERLFKKHYPNLPFFTFFARLPYTDHQLTSDKVDN